MGAKAAKKAARKTVKKAIKKYHRLAVDLCVGNVWNSLENSFASRTFPGRET